MKRDMGLIREILIYVELQPAGQPIQTIATNCDDSATVGEHIQLLIGANLLEGEVVSLTEPAFIINRLTWEGHDFLQAIHNDTVWRKIIAKAKELGGSLTLEIAKELGKKYLADLAGI